MVESVSGIIEGEFHALGGVGEVEFFFKFEAFLAAKDFSPEGDGGIVFAEDVAFAAAGEAAEELSHGAAGDAFFAEDAQDEKLDDGKVGGL